MNSRRNFIKKTGAGLAAAAFAPGVFAQPAEQEKIIIGIIGAENSHTAGFGKLFNIDKKFPGVEVKYVWGETDEFAKRAMERGNIPNQVKDPAEMMGRIDALIVDHRHPKYHLDAARPFVKAGIPAFIDKPFCYRAEKGKEFLQMARETGTPVTSYSSIAQSEATFDIKKQVENMGKIYQVIRTGPVNLDSEYGGVFFYGVHSVQPLMFMFGEDIERVRITRDGSYGNASLKFSGGLLATLVFKQKAYGWETFVETNDELIELKSRVEASNPPKNYVDMVEMFRTGKEPRSYQSILNGVSVLEALEESAETEKWVEVEYV
jgi:predicted dehydrogenase